MSKLTKQNVGGIDYTMVGCTLTGVCASGAADYIKVVTLSDGDAIGDGMTVVVAFTNGNTAGTAPLPTTIYSSDQVNYYADDQLTVPFTLAPAGCYEIAYTGEGNAYSYVSYPIMQVGSVSGPLCDASGNKASGALWLAGDKVSVNYSNGCFNVIPQATDSMTVMTATSVVNGAPLRTGSTVRVMFTADLAGTDTTTGLVLSYNGINTPVKVGKNGSLLDFVASEVSTGVYKYVQAYTTLELAFDGVQFIIIGNPVVLSSTDYTIYADGSIAYTKNFIDTNKVSTGLYVDIDLNTLKTFGLYRIRYNSASMSDMHMPVNSYGILLVANPNTNISQVFYPDNYPYCYIRNYQENIDTWTDWVRQITTEDMSITTMGTVVDNSEAKITYRRTYNVVIFAIHAKGGILKGYTLPFNCVVDTEGIKTGLFWSGLCVGEAYIQNSVKNVLQVTSTSEGSGELVVFM